MNGIHDTSRSLRRCGVLAGLCLFLGYPTISYAVTVGSAKVVSKLEQPLEIEVPLSNATPRELDNLEATLAPESAFRDFGYDYSPVLRGFQFEIVRGAGNTNYLRITTQEPVAEPFLAFMLQVTAGKRRFVRGYTVLLDPAEYPARPVAETRTLPLAGRAAQPIQPQAALPQPTQRPVSPQPAATTRDRFGPVVSGQSLWRIAERLHRSRGVGMSQMMWGLYQANPDAFIGNNANALKKGVHLEIPSPARLAQIAETEAANRLASHLRAWQRKTGPEFAEAPPTKTETTAPPSSADLAVQLSAPELGFDLSPRLTLESASPEISRPHTPEALVSQLLDPTGKAAVETTLAGPDEKPAGTTGPEQSSDSELSEPISETPEPEPISAASVNADTKVEASAPAVGSLGMQRLEQSVVALQDQLASRDQQIQRLEQHLAEMTATVSQAVQRTQSDPSAKLLSPLNILLGLLVLLVGALLGWAMTRRGGTYGDRESSGDTTTLYRQAASRPIPREEPVTHEPPRFEEPEPARREPAEVTPLHPQLEVEELTEEALPVGTHFLTGELRDTELSMKVSETSVLDELEAYISGGYYNDAKNLLLRLVDKEPANIEYRLQLLRVLRILGEGDEFVRQAKLAKTAIEDLDGSIWEDIRRMGSEIRPSEPLFADDQVSITDEEEDNNHLVDFKS